MRSLVDAVARACTDGAVPALAGTSTAQAGTTPDDDSPESAAAHLAASVAPELGGRRLVVVADDLDLLGPDCQETLGQVVLRRVPGVVVLATATRVDATPGLPRGLEVRDLPGLGPGEAVGLLASHGVVVAPHVAARLARELVGNPAALVQTARLLSAAQLAGWSALPDPLPVVPAVRDAVGKAVDLLDEAERQVLLVAAVAATPRTDVLLAATTRSTDDLLRGGSAAHLDLVASRYRFADPRVRALVHGDATVAERTAAHEALAAALAPGDPDVAAWHAALATLEGDADVAVALVRLARRHLHHGDAGAAFEVAREAASHAADGARRRALELAAAAALAGGCVHDATHWARGALRGADPDETARVLGTFVVAVTLSEGQVPLDVVDRAVAHVLDADPRAAGGPRWSRGPRRRCEPSASPLRPRGCSRSAVKDPARAACSSALARSPPPSTSTHGSTRSRPPRACGRAEPSPSASWPRRSSGSTTIEPPRRAARQRPPCPTAPRTRSPGPSAVSTPGCGAT
ncbi:hypothetical protein GCM10025864_23500 [Luteimicrobium album]|uniref:LuxR family transcriptional regulator n=1 Tax=Luteimicrobium album TaxID=1054550 RepID=A0ABQ6I1N4_9MICO|nr:hypothetical protein [Luteimicrobium album]GMA24591.1 hypothetical protein GCM10025864_23500 [Luteimicrobium album]